MSKTEIPHQHLNRSEQPPENDDNHIERIVSQEDTVPSDLFCHCGGLRIKKDQQKWLCLDCEQKANRDECDFVIVDQQEKQGIVEVTERFFHGPKTSETCPECGHGEAYYRLQQIRAADESEDRFFTCGQCEYKWRDND